MTHPAGVYRELIDVAKPAPGHAYRSFPGPPGLGIRAFVSGDTRLPGVSFHLSREDVPVALQFPKMSGATTAIRSEGVGPAVHVVYDIAAAEAAFSSVFIELASRLITDASTCATARDGMVLVAGRLAAWARFFDARARDGLGREAQLGLMGELLCLESLAGFEGLSRGLHAWVGPTGAVHDFQSPDGAIEVKLSTSSVPERFRITSERQLDEEPVKKLLLCAITAQEHAAAEIGLSDLVVRLRELARREAPLEASLLEDRLSDAGYADGDWDKYKVKISVRSIEFARVEGAFPRIRPADLRIGVFAVAYDIPRSALTPYVVPASEAGEIIRGIK